MPTGMQMPILVNSICSGTEKINPEIQWMSALPSQLYAQAQAPSSKRQKAMSERLKRFSEAAIKESACFARGESLFLSSDASTKRDADFAARTNPPKTNSAIITNRELKGSGAKAVFLLEEPKDQKGSSVKQSGSMPNVFLTSIISYSGRKIFINCKGFMISLRNLKTLQPVHNLSKST